MNDGFTFNFPDGVSVPPALRALAEFCGSIDDFFSGDFELRSDDDDAEAWFHGNQDAAAQVAVFGQEGDGSLYALWLRAGTRPESAPVVFLCSEDDATKVLANDLADFLVLLSVGADGLGRWGPMHAPDEEAPHLARYRAWLTKTTEREPVGPKEARALMDSAAAAHAEAFGEFVKQAKGE
jgi:hypothetical protein